ncbi:hypothetical protein FSP39_005420 [Pinctada imbricata]|uniref:Fibronectin type-III domain-containing protein n=1 Tax=Pinctada imbricata TaxID=66713 RepID=A0AA88XEI4_PINIB|nr:hypothetical protein FSP39_005420 [Pinctada imbricata]
MYVITRGVRLTYIQRRGLDRARHGVPVSQSARLKDALVQDYEPTNLVCTPKNSTILEFTWTLPAGGAGVVQGYHLDLVRTDNVKIDILPTVTINGYYVDTYTFYGLGKYAEYTLTMHSFTASGNQADVTSVCRTLEDIPDGAPSGVNATGISYSEIYVEWLELEDFYRNGVLAGYKIVYFDYSSDNPHEITVSSSTLSYTIANLNYDTWYVVSVLGYTSAGDGPRTTDPDKTWGTRFSFLCLIFGL